MKKCLEKKCKKYLLGQLRKRDIDLSDFEYEYDTDYETDSGNTHK